MAYAVQLDLLAIQRNLESDQAELLTLIETHQNGVQAMKDLLKLVEGTGDPTGFRQTMIDLYWSGMSFYPNTGGHKSMISSGNLRWLKDHALASALSDYYDHLVPRLLDNNKVIDDMIVTDLLPWISSLHPHPEDIKDWEAGFPIEIIETPGFYERIGANLGHAMWFVTLLEKANVQVETVLVEVSARLGESSSLAEE